MEKIKYLTKYYHNILSSRLKPYTYSEGRYTDSFLNTYPRSEEKGTGEVERRIYIFWTGNNAMSENRLRNVQNLIEKSNCEVVLVTPDNLSRFILPDTPLHPAFEYLSLVHKSDYLRCYFMHHFGGGYSDIKACQYSWLDLFEELEQSAAYIIGYPEQKKSDLAQVGGLVMKDMRHYFSQTIGNCAYICRANTPFTYEWYQELISRMDEYEPLLCEYPGNILGDNPGYPIKWTGILGDIFHPLNLKYMDKILRNKKLKPVLINYR